MKEHPIENLMLTAMESIRSMIDVNTIIGEPIEISNDITIIPVSKVGFGLAAGGSEFKDETIEGYLRKQNEEEEIQYRLPFGGGAGVGASISPVAFIIIQSGIVKLIPVEHNNSFDKLLDYVPDLFEKVNEVMKNRKDTNEKQAEKIVEQIKKNCNN
ncbi:MAG: GerW family sporulation protein [Clostridia bacterium]|nr:GerW family sporulation protein [Clostridia bacterium]